MENTETMTVTVSDTGIGMDPEVQIRGQSEPGQGTTFTIILPVEAREA